MKPSRLPRQSGFTLAEIAIVLIIMALLSGVAFNALTALTLQSRSTATRDKAKALKVALKAFIGRSGRLPCPAVGTLASTDANFGLEASPTTGGTGAGACPGTVAIGDCGNQLSCLQQGSFRGIVPWRTLGMSQDAAMDPWNHFYTYQVSVSGIVNPLEPGQVVGVARTQAMVGNIPVYNAPAAAGGVQQNVGTEAVVVLLSHGADGLGAYIPGGQMTAPTGATQLENANLTRPMVDADASSDATNPYDDFFTFYSVAEMLDGISFPTPGLETVTGRTRYLAEMVALHAIQFGACPPATPGYCTYTTPTNLVSAAVPLPLQYDATGTLIGYSSGAIATPTNIVFTFHNGAGNVPVTLSADEFWSIGARIGAFH